MTLRRVGIAAMVVSLVVGAIAGALFLVAFQFRLEWFSDPAEMIGAGPASAELLRWAAIADLFSYYLPIGVVAYVMWTTLRPRNPAVVDLATAGAFGYALVGGAAATVLAFVGPWLMHAYAAGGDEAALRTAFGALSEAVFSAIWQFLDAWLLAAWWLGLGIAMRGVQPGFARLSIVLAVLAAVGSMFTLLDLTLIRYAGLALFFVLWLSWSVWLLVLMWRRSPPFGVVDAAAPDTVARPYDSGAS